MKKLILTGALAGAALLTGCSGLPGIPGLTGSAGAGAAGAPELKSLYTAGRKWEYNLTVLGTTDTMTMEVTEVKDNKATLKTTVKGSSSTSTIDLNDKDAFAKMSGAAGGAQTNAGASFKVGPVSNESITVPAGTYACLKTTSTSSQSQGGVTIDITSETWVNSGVGLVKALTTTKTALPAGLPAVPGMPGGEQKTTMELKSFK